MSFYFRSLLARETPKSFQERFLIQLFDVSGPIKSDAIFSGPIFELLIHQRNLLGLFNLPSQKLGREVRWSVFHLQSKWTFKSCITL